MKVSKPVLFASICLLLVLMLGFALAIGGCGESKEEETTETSETTETAKKLSGTLTLAGSTTVLPIAQEAADQFMDENPDVTVTVQGGGSSVGVTQVSEGTVDIGDASRGLKEDEENLGLVDHEIALDVIVVIASTDVTVDNLTADQINGIFTGKITNWSEVGGADAPITVVIRDEASGTREMFDDKTLGEDESPVEGAIETNSNGIMRETVGSTPNSVGYISLGYLDSSVKALKYDGVEGSLETAVDGSYPLSRYLHMFTKGEATGLAEAFIDFVLSDTFQEDVVAEEYIPMTEAKQ